MPEFIVSLGHFLAFVTATGLAAAVFNQMIDGFRERKKRSRQASYLGLRLAAILETFVYDSLDHYAQMSDAISQKRAPERYAIGDLEEYPNDIDGWTALPKDMAGKVLNFKLNLIRRGRDLSYLSSHLDEHSLAEEFIDACIDMSSDAWHLAFEIRKTFDFPSHGKVDARESQSRTGVFLENAANKLAHKRREQGIVESADC